MASYISRISMRDVRSFGKLDLDLTTSSAAGRSEPRLQTIVIGENGTGKSTLLRAIVVGLADRKDISSLLAAEDTGQLVAEGASEATSELELRDTDGQGAETLKTVIMSENGQDVLHNREPKSFSAGLVCGYGVGRVNEGGSDTGRAYRVVDSVWTLFAYREELIGTELGLRRLKDFLTSEWYEGAMARIKEALGLHSSVKIRIRKGGGVRISGPGIGEDIPLEAWADGYRKTLAWILDLYVWAMRAECITPTGDVTGIVLLDELEQHLHPSMQVWLPSRLRKLLPHVQIIATTHSPLVALGVEPDELVVFKRDGDTVEAYESVRDFRGYSVEDMFADPKLFDAPTYPPEMSKKLERYRELISNPDKRSLEEEKELQLLGSDLTALQISEVGENPVLKELQAILKKHNL